MKHIKKFENFDHEMDIPQTELSQTDDRSAQFLDNKRRKEIEYEFFNKLKLANTVEEFVYLAKSASDITLEDGIIGRLACRKGLPFIKAIEGLGFNFDGKRDIYIKFTAEHGHEDAVEYFGNKGYIHDVDGDINWLKFSRYISEDQKASMRLVLLKYKK